MLGLTQTSINFLLSLETSITGIKEEELDGPELRKLFKLIQGTIKARSKLIANCEMRDIIYFCL
jgi:hypothetical protein